MKSRIPLTVCGGEIRLERLPKTDRFTEFMIQDNGQPNNYWMFTLTKKDMTNLAEALKALAATMED